MESSESEEFGSDNGNEEFDADTVRRAGEFLADFLSGRMAGSQSEDEEFNSDDEDSDYNDHSLHSDDENTEESILALGDNYKMHLNEYKEGSTTHISASIKTAANAEIGSMRAYLFNRGKGGNINFWSECDDASQETCDVAMMFTKQDGRLLYEKIEGLDKETDQLVSSRGGFLVIEEVRICKEERGKDLGLDIVDKLLNHLGGRWTIAWIAPFTLTQDKEDGSKHSKEEIQAGNVALARHFARLGFVQASTKENLNDCKFWYLVPGRRARKSKEDVGVLPVVFQISDWTDNSADEEINGLVKAVRNEDELNNEDQLKEITRLVTNGEDINKSEALFYAIPNGEVEMVEHLIQLGADVSLKNKHGGSPLHLAAGCLNAKMCQLLLKLGADKEVTDANGETPFQAAVREIENTNKFVATFGLNKIRVYQFEERREKLTVLHLLARNPLQLTGGILTPRMFYRLKVTAQVSADICRDSMPHFERGVPMSYEDARCEISLLSEVPEDEVPKEIYKSYAWGWQQQLKAIGDVMEKGFLPTESRVQEELRYSGYDLRYNSHYKEKGGSLLHALVALVETARSQSETEGDGQFKEIHGEGLEQVPAIEVLDDDFLFVHYFFVSFCVTPGAALVGPDLNI